MSMENKTMELVEMEVAEGLKADNKQLNMDVDSQLEQDTDEFSDTEWQLVEPMQDSEESAPERTESQRVKALKVEKVLKDVDSLREPVVDLRRSTSVMCAKEKSHPNDVQSLQEELETVQQAHKKARNFGEDLVERMVALDNLSNLATEDRSTRKQAIQSIEGLLEQVDTAKGRLQSMKRDLEQRMESQQNSAPQEPEPKQQPQSSHAGRQDNAAPRKQSNEKGLRDLLIEHLPAFPSHDAWRRLRLPVEFRASEEQGRYVVQARVPGLDQDSVTAKLDEDADSLTIKGLRTPDADEANAMVEGLLSRLEEIARRDSSQLRQVVQRLGPETYLKLGQGKYGSISQTMAVPANVKADRITLNYNDDVLQVQLPKRKSMPYSARNMPVYPRGFAPQRPDPYSSFAMPGLFGGLNHMF